MPSKTQRYIMICGKKRLFTKLQCISSTKILQKIPREMPLVFLFVEFLQLVKL